MSSHAVRFDRVSKKFRLYHERNQFLKAAILKGRRGRYEEFWALNDVSFDVNHGQTVGIIGSNGSGKSSLLKCLAGILYPDTGSIEVAGKIAPLLELGAGFHPELSGRENIFLNAAILGMGRKETRAKYDEIVDFAGIEKFIDSPLKNYSSGMYVRLAFSVAITVDPDILVIDEVLAVGDVRFQRKCIEKIEQFRREGKTMIFVSHGLGQVEQICDDVVWLEKGSVRMLGSATDVVAAYNAEIGNSTSNSPEKFDRWGTGQVQFLKTSLCSSSGEPVDRLVIGDSAEFHVTATKHDSVDSLVLVIKLVNDHGIELWSSSSRRQGISPLSSGPNARFVVSFPEISLLSGNYRIVAVLTDRTEEIEYDHIEAAATFHVDAPSTFDHGLFRLPSLWSKLD